MRPLHLTLNNFKSHEGTDIDLSQLRVALITGSNGAGKSTILDAIVYALYGADGLGLGRQSDRVIREGADTATVSLVFEASGAVYRIIRSRKITGKSTLYLDRRDGDIDRDLTQGTIADTQAKIVEIVGATSETFRQSVYIGQGDAGRFSKATPAERKETLGQALDLDQYVPLRDAAKEQARTAQQQVDSLSTRIADAAAQLEGAPTQASVDQARSAVIVCDSTLAERTEAFESLRKKLADARVAAAANEQAREHAEHLQRAAQVAGQAQVAAEQEWRAADARATENRGIALSTDGMVIPDRVDTTPLAAAVEAAQAAWTRADQRRSEATRILSDLGVARSSVTSIESQLHNTSSQVEGIQRKLNASTVSAPCVTCAQPLGQAAAEKARENLQAQLREAEDRRAVIVAELEQASSAVTDLEAQSAEYTTSVQDLQAADDALKEAREALRVADATNKRHADAADLIAKAAAANAVQAELDANVEAAKTRMDTAVAAYETACKEAAAALALVQASGELDELNRQVRAADQLLGVAQKDLAAVQAQATRVEERFAAAELLRATVTTWREELQPLQDAVNEWTAVARAYGRDGIPNQMIDHARPQIEADINNILSRVGAPYRVRIDLQRDTKAGTVQDTLDLTILADGHERPYDLLSGGEKYRVNTALRVAIGRVLANRSGRRIETLVLDEPEGLDAAGFSALAELITALSSEFGLVLTVSHGEGLDAAADARIHVIKESGRSLVHVAA